MTRVSGTIYGRKVGEMVLYCQEVRYMQLWHARTHTIVIILHEVNVVMGWLGAAQTLRILALEVITSG